MLSIDKNSFKRDYNNKFVQLHGKELKEGNNQQKYEALGSLVRDYVISTWMDTNNRYNQTGEKQVYYFSMEFLLGRLLGDFLLNLGIRDICREALSELDIDLEEIENLEHDQGLGNGGLGRLAACFLDSIATLGLNGDGVGLNYHYGLFKQVFKDHKQTAEKNPWITPESWLNKSNIKFDVLFGGFKVTSTLYDIDVRTINYHIKKIFSDSELQENSVIQKFRITAADGKTYNTNHYSLEMIIAVGFKVNSERAVQFRKWVNQIAKDYTIKGWVMDDERLKRGTYLTEKYFDEQLERIREIRASERKFYQKITDLYATAIDYDRNSATTKRFYATVQNKMHYAVHGHTAAEMIVERADHTKEHMGLTTWADAPDGKIKKSDVIIAKNYLSQDEMKQLNRMVTAYLDFAENMTLRHIPLTMQDWEKRLNSFIEMFDYGILQDAGKVSAEIAKLHAETEFEKYRVIQDSLFMSDFDRYMLELEESVKK